MHIQKIRSRNKVPQPTVARSSKVHASEQSCSKSVPVQKDEQFASFRTKVAQNACLGELIFSHNDTRSDYLRPLGRAVSHCSHYKSDLEVGHLKIQLLFTTSNVRPLSGSRARFIIQERPNKPQIKYLA